MKTTAHLPGRRTLGSICGAFFISLALAGTVPAQILESWGNPFLYGGSTAAPELAATTRFDGRFTAQKDLTADQVVFRTGTVTGTPSMRIEVYSDDAGLPGTLVGQTATIALSSGNSNSSVQANLLAGVSLTAGSVYHFVYVPVSVDANNRILIPTVSGSNITWSPQTGLADPAQNRLFSTNSGSSWTVANANQSNASMPSFALRNSTSLEVAGQVINASYLTTNASIGASTLQGQQFVYEGVDGYFTDEITLRLATGAGSGTGALMLSLLDASDQVLFSQSLVANASELTGTFTDYTFTLDTQVSLAEGDTYRFVLSSPDSAADSYRTYIQRTLFSGYNDGTFQGTDGFAVLSTNSGTSFTSRLDGDVYFSLGMNAVPEPTTASLTILFSAGLILARRKRREA